MKLHKAKAMCFAIHYGEGKLLNWRKSTIAKMEKHRNRYILRASIVPPSLRGEDG